MHRHIHHTEDVRMDQLDIYIYIYIYIYVCMYIYIYIYIYTGSRRARLEEILIREGWNP